VKADQYAERIREMLANPPRLRDIYEDVPPDDPDGDEPATVFDICARVCADLINEGKAICQARRARSPEAVLAIWKELEQKWHAIVRRVGHPDVLDGTFRRVLVVLGNREKTQT